MISNKFNLAEFSSMELEVNEMLSVKGGCGDTCTSTEETSSSAADPDSNSTDSDRPQ